MATPTKIKVGRGVLLARLQEIETENQERYLHAHDVYEDEMEEFRDDLAIELRRLAVLVEGSSSDLDFVSNDWKKTGVEVVLPKLRKPEAPHAQDKTLGKLIRTLELSTEDTITVSATDTYYHYL